MNLTTVAASGGMTTDLGNKFDSLVKKASEYDAGAINQLQSRVDLADFLGMRGDSSNAGANNTVAEPGTKGSGLTTPVV